MSNRFDESDVISGGAGRDEGSGQEEEEGKENKESESSKTPLRCQICMVKIVCLYWWWTFLHLHVMFAGWLSRSFDLHQMLARVL